MILDWVPHAPTSMLAQQLRRDIRARRRAFPSGERFVYKDLSQLLAAEYHVILTHHSDPLWQHWARHPVKGWMPIVVRRVQADVIASAETHEWDIEYPEPRPEPGVYVLAGWPGEDAELQDVVYTIRTHCATKNSAIAVADTLRSIGMVTKHEEVSA